MKCSNLHAATHAVRANKMPLHALNCKFCQILQTGSLMGLSGSVFSSLAVKSLQFPGRFTTVFQKSKFTKNIILPLW